MSWPYYLIIGGLVAAIAAAALVRGRLKHRLGSMDGFIGVTRRANDGTIVGGTLNAAADESSANKPAFRRAFRH